MRESCRKITKIITDWEENGTLSEESFDVLQKHLEECSRCREKYARLIPFLQYDVQRETSREENESLSPSSGEQLGADFTDRVMREVHRSKIQRGPGNTFRVLSASAAVLLVFGLVIRLVVPGPGQPEEVAQAAQYIEVHFTLTAPDAESVSLVGDFTEWETSKIKLKDPNNDGLWEATVKLKKDNVYLYNFVIDGEEWAVDPDSMIQVDDDFGGESSVLKL